MFYIGSPHANEWITSVLLIKFIEDYCNSYIINSTLYNYKIYWQFSNFNPPNSFYICTQFAKSSGYKLANTPYNSSFAGYKDWFIQEYNRPGYTIEAGIGESPLPISQFDEIYKDNIGILILGAVL